MKSFRIGNINITATCEPRAGRYKWTLCEATTGLSLMPSSWPGNYKANTLENAKHLIQALVIDKYGETTILNKITEHLNKKQEGK